MTRIFVFVPAFGGNITNATFLTTHALQQMFSAKGIGGGISTLSFPDIAELRSMAFTIWYDTMPDVSHLLMIDSDMGFPPDMVLDMILHDEPLVGTVYRQRKEEISWAGSGTGTPTTERRTNFMVVEGVGFGCTLIRRDCGDKMVQAYPELIDTRISLHPAKGTLQTAGANRLIRLFEKLDVPDRGLISEDLSFCIRWNRLGGKVWGAIGYRVSHVGMYDYAGRYLDVAEAMEKAQIQAAQAPLPQVVAMPQTNGTNVSEPAPVVAEPSGMPPAQQAGYDRVMTEPEQPVKRKRGRPKKVPSWDQVIAEENKSRAAAGQPLIPEKRQRRRPKEVPVNAGIPEIGGPAMQAKRPRGRPKKSSPQLEAAE